MIVWVPWLFFMVLAIVQQGAIATAAWILLLFLAGMFIWIFTEYFLHRFVFHFHPRSQLGERIVYLYHGVHHEQPLCTTRLVMPPVVSIPLGGVFISAIGSFWDCFSVSPN